MTYINGDAYANNYYHIQSANLMTNITEVDAEILNKVMRLRPIRYQWQQQHETTKNDTATMSIPYFTEDTDFKREHYGFIADEVKKLFPELVKEDENGQQSVNYVEIIPLLIEALNAQQKQITSLQQQIYELRIK